MLSTDVNISVEYVSSANVVGVTEFALDVLNGSFFCLKTLDKESGIVSGILASIFVVIWEYNLGKAVDDSLDDELRSKFRARFTFGESVSAFHHKINDHFCKSLSLDNRKRLESLLIQLVRSAIFSEDKLLTDEIASLCCTWVLEVLECVCVEGIEEENLLHQLLTKDETWPVFVVPNFCLSKVSMYLKTIFVSVSMHMNVIFLVTYLL